MVCFDEEKGEGEVGKRGRKSERRSSFRCGGCREVRWSMCTDFERGMGLTEAARPNFDCSLKLELQRTGDGGRFRVFA